MTSEPVSKVTRTRKWLVGGGVLVGVLAGLGVVAASLIPSDEELGQRAAAKLGVALGAGVTIQAIHWHLLPVPMLVAEGAVIDRPQPITVNRLTLYPDLGAALRHRIKFRRAELDGAVVPQLSLKGLGKQGDKDKPESQADGDSGFTLDAIPLDRFVFSKLTWISRRGIPVVYAGDIDFDAGWRPRNADLRLPDFKTPTSMNLARKEQEDRWTTRIRLGGGTADGEVQLQALPNDQMHLSGKLKPQKIEVANALEAFNRRPAISGKLSGDTTLSAKGSNISELLQSLNTVTPFVMGADSKLLRFDLDKAIRTAGKDHAGQTPLDSITGTLETQNTSEGMVSYFRKIDAKSGSLSASGDARLFNRQIEAEFAVDLVKGVVGVPLKVSGPTNNISVSVPGGAVAGAVVGTAILPVIGTAIGARVGAALGKLFGSGPADKKSGPVTAPKAGASKPR